MTAPGFELTSQRQKVSSYRPNHRGDRLMELQNCPTFPPPLASSVVYLSCLRMPWLCLPTFNNKAIGRCIRHLNDYGVICLIDERFLNGRQSHNLAKWVRDLPRDFTRLSEMGDTMDKVSIRRTVYSRGSTLVRIRAKRDNSH